MRSVSPTFIGCRLPLADARIVIYGIPFEGRVNLRKGADAGTLDVRLGSESIETYSPALQRDLEELAITDIGDCELPDGAPPREQLDAAREQIAAWWRPGLVPFMLGGDHTARCRSSRSWRRHFPTFASCISTPTPTCARSSSASGTTTPRPSPA
jgi:agmatinase